MWVRKETFVLYMWEIVPIYIEPKSSRKCKAKMKTHSPGGLAGLVRNDIKNYSSWVSTIVFFRKHTLNRTTKD